MIAAPFARVFKFEHPCMWPLRTKGASYEGSIDDRFCSKHTEDVQREDHDDLHFIRSKSTFNMVGVLQWSS